MDKPLRTSERDHELFTSAKSWYEKKHKKRMSYKDFFHEVMNDYINHKDIIYLKTNNPSQQSSRRDYDISLYRIDTRIPPEDREIINAAKEYFKKIECRNKKPIIELQKYMLTLLLEAHPGILNLLEKDRLIGVEVRIEEAKEKDRQELKNRPRVN